MPASRDQKEPDFFTLEGESKERIGPQGTFVMKRTNLIKNMTKDFGNNVTYWFSTTLRRCDYEAFSGWLIMHFWHPVDRR